MGKTITITFDQMALQGELNERRSLNGIIEGSPLGAKQTSEER